MRGTIFIYYVAIVQVILFVIGGIIAFRRPLNHKYQRMLPRPIKVTISFSMLFVAFMVFNKAPSEYNSYSAFVLIGMAFSSLGDLIMCRIIKTPNNLIGGMIAFSMGHISYAIAYGKTIISKGGNIGSLFLIALIIFILLVGFGYKLIKKHRSAVSAVEMGAVVYGCIILNMFIFSTFLASIVGGHYWITFLAAIVFMISDSIIAFTDIGGKHFALEGLAVWITYISAQMGIICAILF